MKSDQSQNGQGKQEWFKSARMTALSDGVFAIVLTLLVLELKPDQANPAGLLADLRETLPKLEAWVVSFLSVGAIWAIHHNVIASVPRVDNRLNFLNLLLLMSVSLVPWTADLMGTYTDPWAVVLFSGNLGLEGILMMLSWQHALGQASLADRSLSAAQCRFVTLQLLRIPLVALLSISSALLINRSLGLWAWTLMLPLGFLLRSRYGEGVGVSGEPLQRDQRRTVTRILKRKR
ncbi:MAG: TMEM175 family protein [Armatimonadota bacterium]